MYLILALLFQASPVQIADHSAAKLIIARATEVANNVQEWQRIMDNRFADDLQLPKVGIFIGSAPAPGVDGLHAVTVLGVHANSPAQRVGIKPGDRILYVNQRRLEHESVMVVFMLMDNKPGPVQLTIQRRQRVMKLMVQREPLPCLDQAVDLLDLQKLRTENEKLLNILNAIRRELKRSPTNLEALEAAQAGVVVAARFLEHLTGTTSDNLYRATVTACETTFE